MNKYLKISIIVLVIAVVAYIIYRFAKPKPIEVPEAPAATTPASATAGLDDTFPLKIGSRGPNVQRLQQALNWIKPGNKLVIDGVLGTDTRNALLRSVATTLSGLPLTETKFNTIIKMGNDANK